jgi:hypothetical protein
MSSVVESLYYQTYNNVLLGDIYSAKMYLSFLREEYDKDETQFEIFKKDYRWEHLAELGNVIDNNLVLSKSLKSVPDKVITTIRQEDETVYQKQNDLVRAIILSQADLRMCLSAELDFYCSCTEMETRFGRVDLVAQDSNTVYPIEVKKNGAYHDVVGQIDKYIIHFKLGLINKLYRNVIGVVIANVFDDYVLQELHKFGALAIKYKFKNEKKVEFIKL